MTDANGQAPKILDVPIGLGATRMRQEFDSLGTVEVAADRYWGAQTQRSLQHFNIGDRVAKEVYHAYGYVRRRRRSSTPGRANYRAGRRPDRSA
jgi:fumarate hydratase, class II